MDVSSIASAGTEMSQARTQGSVEMAVAKKAINLQGQAILGLVQAATGAVPAASTANSPAHLGQNINTFA